MSPSNDRGATHGIDARAQHDAERQSDEELSLGTAEIEPLEEFAAGISGGIVIADRGLLLTPKERNIFARANRIALSLPLNSRGQSSNPSIDKEDRHEDQNEAGLAGRTDRGDPGLACSSAGHPQPSQVRPQCDGQVRCQMWLQVPGTQACRQGQVRSEEVRAQVRSEMRCQVRAEVRAQELS
jgi:hypothetical protein